jgi:hypothetical protein
VDDLDELKAAVAELQQQLAELKLRDYTQPGKGSRLKCSFCGKSQDQVKKLIAGPGVHICDECVDLCNEILDEELFEAAPARTPGSDEPPRIILKDDRLIDTQGELLRMVLSSEKWMIRRVASSSVGVQVVVADNPLGTNLEEQVLYASALDEMVRCRLLVQCSHRDNKTVYQLTRKGLLQARILEASSDHK